jgi:hypothetical protein
MGDHSVHGVRASEQQQSPSPNDDNDVRHPGVYHRVMTRQQSVGGGAFVPAAQPIGAVPPMQQIFGVQHVQVQVSWM